MSRYLRVQTVVPHSSGLPEHAVVNSWAFIGNGATRDVDATTIGNGLTTFYTNLKAYLSSQYLWSSGVHNFVDMEDGRPRVPYTTRSMSTFGANNTTNNDLPAEVAVCISMRGTPTSGLNARRRRGRVYLGPLQRSGADIPLEGNATADAIAAAAQDLMDLTNVELAVYSRYTHHNVPVGERISDAYPEVPALLDDSFVPVTEIWVDNAFDTQRRRGMAPSYRSWVYPTP